MNKMVPIALALIVLVSGCVGSSDFLRAFTGGGETVEQSPDIIVLERIGTIPSGTVKAGTQVTAYFDLKNQGEVGSPALTDVLVQLYNWGQCTPNTDLFEPNKDDWKGSDSEGQLNYTFDDLVPNQVERIEMSFTAPTAAQIGFIAADCPINWLVKYKFNARSSDDFTIISNTRLNELQRAGESWQGSDLPQYVGIGPIKMYFDFKTPVPVREQNAIQFSVQAEDKGQGTYPEIAAGTMHIKVPDAWDDSADTTPCGDKFGTAAVEGDYKVYTNSKEIKLINRKTPELICEFKAPLLGQIPERSYTVSANITNYEYVTYGGLDVHVEP